MMNHYFEFSQCSMIRVLDDVNGIFFPQINANMVLNDIIF